jgi:hypothetical protein
VKAQCRAPLGWATKCKAHRAPCLLSSRSPNKKINTQAPPQASFIQSIEPAQRHSCSRSVDSPPLQLSWASTTIAGSVPPSTCKPVTLTGSMSANPVFVPGHPAHRLHLVPPKPPECSCFSSPQLFPFSSRIGFPVLDSDLKLITSVCDFRKLLALERTRIN